MGISSIFCNAATRPLRRVFRKKENIIAEANTKLRKNLSDGYVGQVNVKSKIFSPKEVELTNPEGDVLDCKGLRDAKKAAQVDQKKIEANKAYHQVIELCKPSYTQDKTLAEKLNHCDELANFQNIVSKKHGVTLTSEQTTQMAQDQADLFRAVREDWRTQAQKAEKVLERTKGKANAQDAREALEKIQGKFNTFIPKNGPNPLNLKNMSEAMRLQRNHLNAYNKLSVYSPSFDVDLKKIIKTDNLIDGLKTLGATTAGVWFVKKHVPGGDILWNLLSGIMKEGTMECGIVSAGLLWTGRILKNWIESNHPLETAKAIKDSIPLPNILN